MKLKSTLLFAIGIILIGQSLFSSEKKTYQTERLLSTPPRIDGKLDDDAWRQGEWQGSFIQHEPYNNSEPSQQT